MKKKTRGYLLQIIVLLALIAIGIWRHQNRTYHDMQQAFVMDTLFEIEAESQRKDISAILDTCIIIAEGYEQKFSAYTDSGEVVRVNNFAGEGLLTIDAELVELIDSGIHFAKLTNGRYDVTIGRLADIWDITEKTVPSQDEIDDALLHTGYEKIIMNGSVFSLPKGFKLNLGSIAKGFVVKKIKEYLESKEIEKFLINAGGDLYINSEKPEIIGIQHPRGDRGEVIDKITVQNGAIVSSGDYERYFEVDGIRYHHIIDAKTGYPSDKCVSVTVICEDATIADAFATSAFLMEPDNAIRIADSMENVAVIVYHLDEGNLVRSANDLAHKYLEEIDE